MLVRLLETLACPEDRKPLTVVPFEFGPGVELRDAEHTEILEGVLRCGAGHHYPVTGGIPRMLPGALDLFPAFARRWKEAQGKAPVSMPPSGNPHAKTLSTLRRFQLEWERHDLQSRTWGFDQVERLEHFLRYVAIPREDLVGKRVLDAGCGTGQLTCTYATLGCDVIGVDLSPALARGWSLRRSLPAEQAMRVQMVQGDLQWPPFRDGVFDVIHSSGVLHHTPDTRRTLAAMVPLLRVGGVCAVWLYKPTPGTRLPLIPGVRARWLSVSSQALRRVTPQLPPALLYACLYAYSAFFQAAYALNTLLRKRPHDQSIRERVTSLFDFLAPPYRWTHEPSEVARWFAELGLSDVRDSSLPDDPHGFSIRGVCVTPSHLAHEDRQPTT